MVLELLATSPSDLRGYWVFAAGDVQLYNMPHARVAPCALLVFAQPQDSLLWWWPRGMSHSYPKTEAATQSPPDRQGLCGIALLHFRQSAGITLRPHPKIQSLKRIRFVQVFLRTHHQARQRRWSKSLFVMQWQGRPDTSRALTATESLRDEQVEESGSLTVRSS